MSLITRTYKWLLPALAAGLLPSGALFAQPAGLPDFTGLVDQAGPAVVNIRTTARVGVGQQFNLPEGEEGDPFYEFFRRFFPNPQPQPRPGPQGPRPRDDRPNREVPRGLGSGFVIGADGFLLTNAHVVFGADEIIVTMPDRRELKAKLIGADRRTDVALLKVEATGLTPLKIGDPNRLKVGEWVIAIGSPFGLDNTVTAGIVSAKNRETNELLPFIQTDVAVNPGNSGGPLINMRGEAVGINSQIFTTSGGYNGISLAIPIDEAMRVADQLRTSGRVMRGMIGIQFDEVSKDVAEAIGLGKPQGALVVSVSKDGPAQKAGVEAGDVILRFDGKAIDRSRDLQRVVFALRPNTKTSMTVWRKGQQREFAVTVGELQEPSAQQPGRGETPGRPQGSANALGLAVSDVSAERVKELRTRGAVQVDAVEGPAARAGLRAGDIIVSINNTDVLNVRQFNELVSKLDGKKPVALLVQRGEQRTFVIVRPTER
jgi:serine protease Do